MVGWVQTIFRAFDRNLSQAQLCVFAWLYRGEWLWTLVMSTMRVESCEGKKRHNKDTRHRQQQSKVRLRAIIRLRAVQSKHLVVQRTGGPNILNTRSPIIVKRAESSTHNMMGYRSSESKALNIRVYRKIFWKLVMPKSYNINRWRTNMPRFGAISPSRSGTPFVNDAAVDWPWSVETLYTDDIMKRTIGNGQDRLFWYIQLSSCWPFETNKDFT